MDYNYYKNKYKKITLQFDREKDADVINFLELFPRQTKNVICECLRFLIRHWKGSTDHD